MKSYIGDYKGKIVKITEIEKCPHRSAENTRCELLSNDKWEYHCHKGLSKFPQECPLEDTIVARYVGVDD